MKVAVYIVDWGKRASLTQQIQLTGLGKTLVVEEYSLLRQALHLQNSLGVWVGWASPVGQTLHSDCSSPPPAIFPSVCREILTFILTITWFPIWRYGQCTVLPALMHFHCGFAQNHWGHRGRSTRTGEGLSCPLGCTPRFVILFF